MNRNNREKKNQWTWIQITTNYQSTKRKSTERKKMQRLRNFQTVSDSWKYMELESKMFRKIFEEIMSPNFPSFMKYTKLSIQYSQCKSRINTKKSHTQAIHWKSDVNTESWKNQEKNIIINWKNDSARDLKEGILNPRNHSSNIYKELKG